MTVRELIELLKTQPQECPVVIGGHSKGLNREIQPEDIHPLFDSMEFGGKESCMLSLGDTC